jgi:hypothetical protein
MDSRAMRREGARDPELRRRFTYVPRREGARDPELRRRFTYVPRRGGARALELRRRFTYGRPTPRLSLQRDDLETRLAARVVGRRLRDGQHRLVALDGVRPREHAVGCGCIAHAWGRAIGRVAGPSRRHCPSEAARRRVAYRAAGGQGAARAQGVREFSRAAGECSRDRDHRHGSPVAGRRHPRPGAIESAAATPAAAISAAATTSAATSQSPKASCCYRPTSQISDLHHLRH